MFRVRRRETTFDKVLTFSDLMYQSIVHTIRKAHGNALMSIAVNLLQMIIFVLALYLMFTILGLCGAVLRGDFMVYIMSGFFLFITHIKTVGAITRSDGPASPMMKNTPMNTSISIVAAALSQLYIQMMSSYGDHVRLPRACDAFYHSGCCGCYFHNLAGLVHRIRNRLGLSRDQTLVTGHHKPAFDDLPACQYDLFWQNVRR